MPTKPPNAGASASEIIDALNAMDPKDAVAWLESNYGQMDAYTSKEVLTHIYTTGGRRGKIILPNTGDIWDYYENVGGSMPGTLDQTAEKRAAQFMQDPNTTADLNNDGKVDESEQKAFDREKAKAIKKYAKDTGQKEEKVAGQVDQNEAFATIPAKILQATGGVAPDDATIQTLIDRWNQYNPSRPIYDKVSLYKAMANAADPMVDHVLTATFSGEEPVIDYRIKLLDGNDYVIQGEQFAAAQQFFQGDFDSKELTYLVRTAAQMQLTDATGNPAWQVLGALSKALGITENVQDTQYKNNGRQATALPNSGVGAMDKLRLLTRAKLFQVGMDTFSGNVGLAYVYALDQQLALRLSNTKQESWNPADVHKANQLFVNGGFAVDTTNLGRMGYSTDTSMLADLLTGSSANGPSGAERTMPDPVALRQSAKDLYKSMFLADPSEGQLDEFVGKVQGMMTSAPDNQQVDGSARLRDLLEGTAIYKELYGKMPSGMTEAEYQSQFRQGAASMLGNEAADPNTVRSGMRTGKYQTTIGAVAASDKAWNNSTFRGRLAQAAQIVSEYT